MPPCCHPARCCPRLGSARTPRASGWPALDTAGRPPARTAAHGQDGWLGTGSLHGWSCSGGGCSGVEIGFKVADREQHIPHPLYGCAARSIGNIKPLFTRAHPPAPPSISPAPPLRRWAFSPPARDWPAMRAARLQLTRQRSAPTLARIQLSAQLMPAVMYASMLASQTQPL